MTGKYHVQTHNSYRWPHMYFLFAAKVHNRRKNMPAYLVMHGVLVLELSGHTLCLI